MVSAMASLSVSSTHFSSTSSHSVVSISLLSPSPSLHLSWSPIRGRYRCLPGRPSSSVISRRASHLSLSQIRCSRDEPLKVMISGAAASGKCTQCELIIQKFGLVHISTGDLLKAEVLSGTELGNRAKEFTNSGCLVPDEIMIAMVAGRLSRQDTKEHGWLLDGFPQNFTQAQSLNKLNIKPDIFLLLEVPDETLLGKQNSEAIMSAYSDVMIKINANRTKEVVFEEIQSLLSKMLIKRMKMTVTSSSDKWRGIPTRLNNIPHSRDIRDYFYEDVLQSTIRSVSDGNNRLRVDINIPELNPEMDVYRIGTLMELVRALALSFAYDGKRVKVCVQGSMGEGALVGMPLQLAGTRKILEYMDWGDDDALGTFIKIGSIGGKEVEEEDDMFILVAPQNAVGNCIIDDLQAMTNVAGKRPVILINPRLKDLPASSGIMQTMGREERLEYALTFDNCYLFRLLYYAGTQYPIMGALRFSYPYRYELYKRVTQENGKEKYVLLSTYSERPTPDEVNDAFSGKTREQSNKPSGIWGFLSGMFF